LTPTNWTGGRRQRWNARIAEWKQHSFEPPVSVTDAFISGSIQVGKFCVREIVLDDWRIWQRTDNAIVHFLRELEKPKAFIEDGVSTAVAVWMLTHTYQEVDESLDVTVDEFKARCAQELGWQTSLLVDAVIEQVRRWAATPYVQTQKVKIGVH
jgi:hypothetical protein